ncbi:hypothetical protein FXW78_22595 [Rhodococcus opacus]|nr:hypothetical protein [Rhodococcus opacus]
MSCAAGSERTRAGRFVVALREDEPLAASLGVHPLKYRVLAFMLSAAVASLAGSPVRPSRSSSLTPSLFSFHASVTLIACVVLGGLGYRFGPPRRRDGLHGLTQWLHVGGDYSERTLGRTAYRHRSVRADGDSRLALGRASTS